MIEIYPLKLCIHLLFYLCYFGHAYINTFEGIGAYSTA